MGRISPGPTRWPPGAERRLVPAKSNLKPQTYTVENILAQRPNASAPRGLEFKVRWRGYGMSHDTWEPVSSFVPRINTPFMDYIRKHKTKIHVSDLAALTRAIAARGA